MAQARSARNAEGRSSGKKAAAKKPTNQSLVDNITKRFRVTAREAKDIVKAVENARNLITTDVKNRAKNVRYGQNPFESEAGSLGKGQAGKAIKNVVKQVGEVGVTAATGRPGTRPGKIVGLVNAGEWPLGTKLGKQRKKK